MFGAWLDDHELREAVLQQPDELQQLLPEFVDFVVEQLTTVLDVSGANDLVGVRRCGALFGLVSLSKVVSRVESAVRGRLLLSFAGRYEGTGYRLLDARPGWNYHAVPIPSEPA
jgi:predicted GNAT family N-acyltransferase